MSSENGANMDSPRTLGWKLGVCRRCGERHGTRRELSELGMEVCVALFNQTLLAGRIDAWPDADKMVSFLVAKEVRAFFFALHNVSPVGNWDAGIQTAYFIERVSREAVQTAEHAIRNFRDKEVGNEQIAS